MKKIRVRYQAEAQSKDIKHYDVFRYEVYSDNNSFYSLANDERKCLVARDLPKWNAEYAAAALNYFNHKIMSESNDVFIVDSLDFFKDYHVNISNLAFYYVRDTLGDGWAISKAYKLAYEIMIDMWLKGASFRFGILDIFVDKKEVFEELSSAINKVISVYGKYA